MFQISLVSLYGVYKLIIAPLTLRGLLVYVLIDVQAKKIILLAVSTSRILLVVLGFL